MLNYISQTVCKPYTSRIGLLKLSRAAALPFSPGGAGLKEPSTARARLFFKDELYQQSDTQLRISDFCYSIWQRKEK